MVGGNDIIGYEFGFFDKSYEKEIGDMLDYNNNTVTNDFRKAIDEIKKEFPNAKILYLQINATDNLAFEIMSVRKYFDYKTLDEINARYNTSFKTLKEVREATLNDPQYETMFKDFREGVTKLCDRATKLNSIIPQVCNEKNIEYLDLSSIIVNQRAEDDGNKCLQGDGIHFTNEGYNEILPHVIQKIKSMF